MPDRANRFCANLARVPTHVLSRFTGRMVVAALAVQLTGSAFMAAAFAGSDSNR